MQVVVFATKVRMTSDTNGENEIARGAARERARTKIESWHELLEICRAEDGSAG